MSYRFVGVSRISFTSDKGELIQGYKAHFLEPSDRGIGWQPFGCFLTDDRFFEIFGKDLNQWKSPAEQMLACDLTFGRRRNLISINIKK